MYVIFNYNYILDSNGTKLKPKKSQACHTNCALWNFP